MYIYNKKLLQVTTHSHVYNTFIVKEILNTMTIIEAGPPPRCDQKSMELRRDELDSSVRRVKKFQENGEYSQQEA